MGLWIGLFYAIAALFGAIMAWRFHKKKQVGYGLIIPHGSSAFVGTVLLLIDVLRTEAEYRLYLGWMALGFFFVAVALGLTMLYMHRKLGAPRPAFIFFHVFMALGGLFLLIAYLTPV